jgi:predicted esterase
MSSSIRRAAPLIVPAVERHTATVIFFHGLGDQGQGWVDVVEMMRQTKRRLGQVKFILPNAPTIPITMVSPALPQGTNVELRKIDADKVRLVTEWRVPDARLV